MPTAWKPALICITENNPNEQTKKPGNQTSSTPYQALTDHQGADMDYEPLEDPEQEEEDFLIDTEDFYDLLMEQQEQM